MTQRFDEKLEQTPEDSKGDVNEPQHTARRRFVKQAAVVAPAVMTLRGGQALAQTSFARSACISEMSAMGQKAQNAMGDELYFIVDVGVDGRISVSPASKGDPGAQTISPSCFASLA